MERRCSAAPRTTRRARGSTRFVWPTGEIGLGSDPKLSPPPATPYFHAATARIPWGLRPWRAWVRPPCPARGHAQARGNRRLPERIHFLRRRRRRNCQPHPGAVNKMLLQSYQGVLRLFPDWPKDRDARFGQLRAYGAFLVSSELTGGAVTASRSRAKGPPLHAPQPLAGQTPGALPQRRQARAPARRYGDLQDESRGAHIRQAE